LEVYSIKLAIFHMGFVYTGGGERVAIYESIALKERGYDVACYAPAIRVDECFPDLIRQVDLRRFLPSVKMKIPLRDFLSMSVSSAIPRLFAYKFTKFDAFLCHGQPAAWIGYCVARTLGKKYICYLHQPTRFLYPRTIDQQVGWKTKKDFALLNDLVGLARPLVQALDHVSITSGQTVLVNSSWIASQVKKIYGVLPVVCPPGVDIRKYTPRTEKSSATVRGFVVKTPYILTTNRHYPQKGLEHALHILARIVKESDIKLIVTGHFTSYTSTLLKLAVMLGIRDKLVLTGRVDETSLVSLYQNADVYIYTPPCEDFGLGPVEAMACGTTPVVWDYAGPAETVDDGVTGYKAKPYDLDDFAAKVMQLLSNSKLRKEMGIKAASFVRRHYSWDQHMDRLESILRSLT